jgi:hypothetical protein
MMNPITARKPVLNVRGKGIAVDVFWAASTGSKTPDVLSSSQRERLSGSE